MPRDDGQLTGTALEITKVCDELREMLLDKNARYGDSALDPRRIFSKADAVEQIKVRLDDKLSRLEQAKDGEREDVELDLMGYLVLLRIARLRAASAKEVVKQIVGNMPSGAPVFEVPDLRAAGK